MNKTNKNKSVLLSENENMKKEKIKDESTKEIKKVLRLKYEIILIILIK